MALTPLHLLNTNFSPPVPAAVEKNQVHFLLHTQTRSLALLFICTLSPNTHPVCLPANTERGWMPIMTLQVQVQVTQLWPAPSFLDFSSFFSSRSFHLGITIIKSSGSYIEFESLYFSPIVVFHPSCHSTRNRFPLLAWADFQLCCACIFYIYHQICRARPVWKPETLNYVETYF